MRRRLSNLLRRWANRLMADPEAEKARLRLERVKELQAALMPRLGGVPKSVPDWTQEHQGALKRFVESDSGLVLLARLEATSYLNFTAMGREGTEIRADQAARAAGYHDCIRHMESLSRVSLRDNEDNKTLTDKGESELSERLTP